MNRNNDVFQVLVTQPGVPLMGKDLVVEDLLPGQLGIFDANTNKSVDATSQTPRAIYFAVGVSNDGSGYVNDLRTSAGQYIPLNGITKYSFKAHTAAVPMKVVIGGYTSAKYDTDYGIRLEFRNSRIYRIQGFNQFSKAFALRTPASPDGVSTVMGANAFTGAYVAEINANSNGLVIANSISRGTITVGAVVDAVNVAGAAAGLSAITAKNVGDALDANDLAVLDAYNATNPAEKFYASIELTSVPLAIGNWVGVNLGYHKLLQTVIIASLVDGFASSGAVTVSQYPVFEEGSANNIMQKEYHASGWAGTGPYRLSEVTGTAKNDIQYLAEKGVTYDQFIFEYTFKSEAGWRSYESPLSTIIAFPESDVTQRQAFANIIDSYIQSFFFDALTDDAALSNSNPSAVEEPRADESVDGIA